MRMTKKYEKLNEEFNVSDNSDDLIKPEIIEPDLNSNIEIADQTSSSMKDIKKDYEYTRGNLYSLIEKGQEAISGILELAQESEMPRAYEVAGQLIKNVADATDKLMDLQKKLKEVEEGKAPKGPTNVTNALFVGSTAELAKLLKKQSNNENV